MSEDARKDRPASADPGPNKTMLMSFGALWVASMGGLIYAALPSTANFTSGAPVAKSEEFKTPRSTDGQNNTKPAMIKTAVPANSKSDLTLIPDTQTVDFIVRFKTGIDQLDACTKTYHEDEDAARKIFEEWAASHESMADLTLKKVSYSGEMLLVWDTGLKRPLLKTDISAKLEKIKAMAAVRYADPDYTAQAEGTR